MRGTRIPTAKRVINNPSFPPLNPADLSEANALNLMFLWDNMGTGEYLEDAAIAGRHVKQLFAREQATPNMTLEVLAGIGWFSQNSYVNFAGGNSPAFVAPGANPRIDVLTLRSDGALYVIQGAEAAVPTVPTIPSTDIPLAQIYNRVGETVIHDNDTQVAGQGYIQFDLRPFMQVAVGSSAMPKIGLVERTQSAISVSGIAEDTGLIDVVNFSGVGRVNSIHQAVVRTSGGNPQTVQFILTIDGVVFITDSDINLAATINNDIMKRATDQANSLARLSQTASPSGATPAGTDLFIFKASLRIQHRILNHASVPGSTTSTITLDWEHE